MRETLKRASNFLLFSEAKIRHAVVCLLISKDRTILGPVVNHSPEEDPHQLTYKTICRSFLNSREIRAAWVAFVAVTVRGLLVSILIIREFAKYFRVT